MNNAEPKLLLIVTYEEGLTVRDSPRPESKGGKVLRKVSVGSQLYAYEIHHFDGVAYARIVPINPQRPEWIRVSFEETEYVEVIDLSSSDSTQALANAVTLLANAITLLATSFREWVKVSNREGK
jgi:hypothetical protein